MNNRFIYFLISLTVSLSIKTTKKTTLKTQKITYGNEITLKSVNFQDNCYALDEGYTFEIEMKQTSSNYALILEKMIYLQQVSNPDNLIPCTCISNINSNTLNCSLDEAPSTTNLNNKEFKIKEMNDIEFPCVSSQGKNIQTCLLKSFDLDETITYHNLYDVLSGDQNSSYIINYNNKKEGEIYIKFETFLMGESPDITLNGVTINNCEEISYPDEEDEGEFVKCTISKNQFPMSGTYNVIVINQCGYEEYPGIDVVIIGGENNTNVDSKVDTNNNDYDYDDGYDYDDDYDYDYYNKYNYDDDYDDDDYDDDDYDDDDDDYDYDYGNGKWFKVGFSLILMIVLF